jgi:uroporphyrinogen-III synthase
MKDASGSRGALAGRRVVVTRAAAQSASLREALSSRGAEVLFCPVLRIETAAARIPPLDRFAWLVFTSRNAVRCFGELLRRSEAGPGLPAGPQVAVVGPGTAEALAALGREPDLVADPPTGEGLAAAFTRLGLSTGATVLRVRGDLAPPDLEEALRALGAAVTALTAYHTRTVPPPPEAARAVAAGAVDAVTFFSPSAIRGFEEALGDHALRERALAACVGPVTAAAAAAAGWRRVLTAPEPAAEALAAALVEALAAPG